MNLSICHFKRICFITVYKSQYKNTGVSEDTCYLSYDDRLSAITRKAARVPDYRASHSGRQPFP